MATAGDDADITAAILAARPRKNAVDERVPYAFLVEPECSAEGRIEDVATIFLTNRECPFRCLMCDLWKNTTDHRVAAGSIPGQIDYALDRLPPARHVKLYNSGNFFDRQAIPPEDYAAIAERAMNFETVIVENHPRLCGSACLEFRDLVQGRLEVALGLETAHPEVLARLNKQMTLGDFRRAAEHLQENGIPTRAFILLRPPFLSESEGLAWARESVKFAFDCGVRCCSLVPTRAGNGIMERLAEDNVFAPPSFASMEKTLQWGIELGRGRVFMDLWDAERFLDCPRCGPPRRERLRRMNLQQEVLPAIVCDCGGRMRETD